jgi:hypothetical protein
MESMTRPVHRVRTQSDEESKKRRRDSIVDVRSSSCHAQSQPVALRVLPTYRVLWYQSTPQYCSSPRYRIRMTNYPPNQ